MAKNESRFVVIDGSKNIEEIHKIILDRINSLTEV
jgi:thymidylate kinase